MKNAFFEWGQKLKVISYESTLVDERKKSIFVIEMLMFWTYKGLTRKLFMFAWMSRNYGFSIYLTKNR